MLTAQAPRPRRSPTCARKRDVPIRLTDLPRFNVVAMRDDPRPRERRKYRNVPTQVDGLQFDSRAEARRWAELNLLAKAGQIRNLQRQVRYELIPAQKRPSGGTERACVYVADFVYEESPGWRTVVEDVKGFSTGEYAIKRKLLLHVHGIEVKETAA